MRNFTLAVAVLALAGCSKKDEQPSADTPQMIPAAATEPAVKPISLADVAGEWDVTARNEAGDSVLTKYVLTADTTGWGIKFPDRKEPVAARVVAVAGDSIVTVSGPYASVLRKGVQVTTDGVWRLKDGKLVGRSVAHYNVKTADSVRVIVTEGTKK